MQLDKIVESLDFPGVGVIIERNVKIKTWTAILGNHLKY